MNRWARVGMAVSVMVAVTAAGAAAAPPVLNAPVDGCIIGTPQSAATGLVHEDATVTEVADVAGLRVATAVDPRITPGFANALLAVGDAWCSVRAFNAAATEHLPGAGVAEIATAFASVAAMEYLGAVTVSDVAVAGPSATLTTTGGRHGATSTWTVTVDAKGVSSARFTTTDWSPRPRVGGGAAHGSGHTHGSIGALEGITSLPGHSRTFARAPDGQVRIDATVDDLLAQSRRDREAGVARAAALVGNAPGDDLAHTFSDGLTIKVSYGMSPYTPDAGVDTGVKQADRLRRIHTGMIVSYEDFLRWGVSNPFGNTSRTVLGQQTGLPEKAGYINVDSPLAPVCLACAYLADAMEIHVALLFPEIAPIVAGVSYPDSEQFLNGVLGHEMVHSLQGGYSDGRGGVFTSAFIEGTARASESLHDDARHTYQTGSIAYVDNANGCEGFENGRGTWVQAQAAGPFNGHTYDACYFWWTYYATHGAQGLTKLLKAMPTAIASSEGDAAARNLRLLEVAAGGDGAMDLARWGAAFTAGNDADGFTIAAGRTGEHLNWFSLLRSARRSTRLAASQEVTVSDGGVRGYAVASPGTITAMPERARTYVFDVVERRLVGAPAKVGSAIHTGQIVVVVAPLSGTVTGTLAVG